MDEFERAIEFLKTKDIAAFEYDNEVNVEVETRGEILPMVLKLKKYFDECGYKKSWRVSVSSEYAPLYMEYEERHSY